MWMHIAMDGTLLLQFSAALLACLASYFLLSKALSKKRAPLPPGPRGLPLVGYLPFLGTQLHLTFAKLGNIYGPIYKVCLGNKIYVVVSSPEFVKEIVSGKDLIFANRDAGVASSIVTYGKNDIAFNDYGPEWRKMRKIFVHKMLGNAALDGSFGLRRAVVQKSVKEIYGQIGQPVKIGCIGLLTVVNSMVAMIWGAAAEGGETDWEGMLSELMVVVIEPNLSDFFPALAWMDLQGIAGKMTKLFNRFEQVFEEAINRIRSETDSQEGDGKGSFLQHLMSLQDGEDHASSLSMDQIKAILMDTAVGGTDTTATILEWALSELLLHPQEMKVAQDELMEIVGPDSTVNESHLSKLRYLEAVVKETLRLHPAFPLLIPRRPSEDTEVGGYLVPKNSTIIINSWTIHRDPSLWDSPLEFRPKRFLEGPVKWDFSGNDFKYVPFGSGRRKCPGLPLADRALMYTLAMYLHCFNWEVPKGEMIKLEERFGLILKKRESLVAVPTLRLSNEALYQFSTI